MESKGYVHQTCFQIEFKLINCCKTCDDAHRLAFFFIFEKQQLLERAGLDVKPLALFIQHYSVFLNPYVPDDRGAFLFMLFVFSLCTLELYALFFFFF